MSSINSAIYSCIFIIAFIGILQIIVWGILGYIFRKGGSVKYPIKKYDKNGNLIYWKDVRGEWWRAKYDEEGREIFFEDSNGVWKKYEYDRRGNEISCETSGGYWEKSEYDENGKLIKRMTSND